MDRAIFIKYFEGTISPIEEKELLDWVEASSENKRVFMQERQIWDMLLLNGPDEQENLRLTPSEGGDRKFSGRKIFLELAKIAAIFIGAFLVSYFFFMDKVNTKQAWNTIEVPSGQRTHLTLADGSKVWLNAKTKFTFPDRFSKENRTVKLDGEAIFDVTHNADLPFIVETEKYNVKVLGTEFNVYAYSQSNAFETTLLQGKVVISKVGNDNEKIELKPDQMAQNNDSGELELKSVNTHQSVYWREGIYSFENESLKSIFERLERYYEVEFDVKNKKILNDSFTGKFRYRDPIEVILEVVKKSSWFRYSKRNNRITIY